MFPSTSWVAAVTLLLLGETSANSRVQRGIQEDGVFNISMTGRDMAQNITKGELARWTSISSFEEINPHVVDQKQFHEKVHSNGSIRDILLNSVRKMFPQEGFEDSLHRNRINYSSSPIGERETLNLRSKKGDPEHGALTSISLVRTALDLADLMKVAGVVGPCSISPNTVQSFIMRMFDQLIIKQQVLEEKDNHPRNIHNWDNDLHPMKNIVRFLALPNREVNCNQFADESHNFKKQIEKYFLGFDSGVNEFLLNKIKGVIPFFHASKIGYVEKVRTIIHFLCEMSFKLEMHDYRQCKKDIFKSLTLTSQISSSTDAQHQHKSRTKRFLIFDEKEPVLDIERSGYADDYSHDSSYVVVTDEGNDKSHHHLFFGKFGLAIGTYILMVILCFKAFVMSNRGPPGRKGDKGKPGMKGDVGPKGLPGYPGKKGQQGEKGERGFHGTPGADGTPGDKGDTGKQGHPGTPGTPGVRGDDGSKGDKGPTGNTGPRGYPGLKGPRGPRGRPAYYEPTIPTGYGGRSLSDGVDDVNNITLTHLSDGVDDTNNITLTHLSDGVVDTNNITLTHFEKLDNLKEYAIIHAGESNETDAEEFNNFTDNVGVETTTEESPSTHSAKVVGPEITTIPNSKVTRQSGPSEVNIKHHHSHTSDHPRHHHHHVASLNPRNHHHHHQQHHHDDHKHSTSHDEDGANKSSGHGEHEVEVIGEKKSYGTSTYVPVEREEDQSVKKKSSHRKMGPGRQRRSMNDYSGRQELVDLPLYNSVGMVVPPPQPPGDRPSKQNRIHLPVDRQEKVSMETNSLQNMIHSPSKVDDVSISSALSPPGYDKHVMSPDEEAFVVDAMNSLWREHGQDAGCGKCLLFEFLEQQPFMNLDSYIIAGFSHILGASESLQLLDDVREGKAQRSKMRCQRRNNTCDLEYQTPIGVEEQTKQTKANRKYTW